MIERKLIVGRYIDLPSNLWPKINGYAAQNAGDFVAIPLKLFNLEQSAKSKTHHGRLSTTAEGVNTKVHRNFQWLTYYPYRVTYTPITGMDVLTGWMSGCRITAYRHNGTTYVAHIGTADDVAKNTATKNAWNLFAQGPNVQVISGFNPFGHWTGNTPAKQQGDNEGKCLALVTTTLDLYSVYLYRQQGTTTVYRIADIAQMQSLSAHQLQNI